MSTESNNIPTPRTDALILAIESMPRMEGDKVLRHGLRQLERDLQAANAALLLAKHTKVHDDGDIGQVREQLAEATAKLAAIQKEIEAERQITDAIAKKLAGEREHSRALRDVVEEAAKLCDDMESIGWNDESDVTHKTFQPLAESCAAALESTPESSAAEIAALRADKELLDGLQRFGIGISYFRLDGPNGESASREYWQADGVLLDKARHDVRDAIKEGILHELDSIRQDVEQNRLDDIASHESQRMADVRAAIDAAARSEGVT